MTPTILRGAVAATALLLATAAPSAAAWKTETTVHGAKLQACRSTVDDRPVIQVRLDNRSGEHAHRGGIHRVDSEQSRTVRAAAGRISRVKRIGAPAGSGFDTFVGEINGPSAGGGVDVSRLPRC